MINITNVNVQNVEQDMESGDAYYTVEVTIMEPGAAFLEDTDEDKIEETVRDSLSFLDSILGGDNK